jgi:Domain of unknown function (DUF3943)
MRIGRLWAGLWALMGCLGSIQIADAQELRDSRPADDPSFWHAAGGVLTLNGLPWAYNWYVQRWPWAKVGIRAWGNNLRVGFVWDDDCFLDNQLAHPYHGSLYLNSARTSGYGFWGSVPYVALGSMSWELFLENVKPSLNDFVNTTLGGMALGEVTYRLSSLFGSRRGSERNPFSRELGAIVLSPISQAQGLLRPAGREPGSPDESRLENAGWIGVGRRSNRPYVMFAYEYGSPFDQEATKPYDAFEASLQLGPDRDRLVRHVGISGLLARRDLSRSARSQIVLALYQHYDYNDLPSFESAGQSLSGALFFRRKIGSRTQLRFSTNVEALILGAISSDQGQYWRRDYDYGAGAGTRFFTSLRLDGRDLLRFDGRVLWLHSLYGARADHIATYLRLGTGVRLGRFVAVGGDIGVSTRQSRYRDGLSVTERVPETRVYLVWPPS